MKGMSVWVCTNPDSFIPMLKSRYPLAILATLGALGLQYALIPLFGHQNLYHTLWIAVAFSSWYCGLGPSIAATVLGTLGIWFYFVPPIHSFTIGDRSQAFGMIGFLIFASAIIALGESNRRGVAARSRLAAIVASSDDAIVSKDLNGVITSWNAGAQRIFGYTAEEAIGRHISLIVPRDRGQEEATILERLRRGERVDHFETVRVRKGGTTVDVSLTISPVRDSGGRVIGASKVARDITERKRFDVAVKESELSARLLQLQDEERRRLARELHDGLGQHLAAMSMNASRIGREKSSLSADAARCADENSSLIEQVSAEIRTMSYLLHPPLLDELGLHSALEWYTSGFAERSKIATKLVLPAVSERLPQDYELCLFRVAQECLTNIHRHSGCSNTVVKLTRTPGKVELEITDDGRGVNQEVQEKIASGASTGVGLRGLRERLNQLGGSFKLHSNGNGTTLIATLPFAECVQPLDRPAADELVSPGGTSKTV
jgi:PAS domain S-box-containing protein